MSDPTTTEADVTYFDSNLPVGASILSKTGKAYTVVAVDEKGATLARESGSTVRVTRAAAAKALARLDAGEEIPFREISYTVAKEDAVIAALGASVDVDKAAKVYRGAK